MSNHLNMGSATGRVVWLCGIKVLGFQFIVESESEAQNWIEQDEFHYAHKTPVHAIEIPQEVPHD